MSDTERPALDIFDLARASEDFRREIATGAQSQVVVMTLGPEEEIGEETHDDADQILLFVEGDGEAILDGAPSPVASNQLVLVTAGIRHNVRNTGPRPLRLISIYAPPEHPPGTVHKTKAEADAEHHH